MDDPKIFDVFKEKIRQSIDTIIVPQGAEYQAVCKGLRGNKSHSPNVIAVPMTYEPLKDFLLNWLMSQLKQECHISGVLMLGLAGSLSQKYPIGEWVIYQQCLRLNPSTQQVETYLSDPTLSSMLRKVMGADLPWVTGINSDRFISSITDKIKLAQQYQADVVDMESAAAFAVFQEANIPMVVIRAISDDINQDMPDLGDVINTKGELATLPLVLRLLAHPFAGLRLIQGSQTGLKTLEQLVNKLFGVS